MCPRHNAQRALAANEVVLEVITRVVFEGRAHARDHRTIGQHRLKPQDGLARHAVAQHAVTAGIGGNEAAYLARAAAANVHRKHPALRLHMLVHGLQRYAGLHRQRALLRVKVFNSFEPLHGQHDLAGLWHAAGHQSGHAPLNDHRLRQRMQVLHHLCHLVGRARAQHRQRFTALAAPVLAVTGLGLVAGYQAGCIKQRREGRLQARQ